MTWTYTGDPSASTLEEIRFLLGDIVSTDPLITDEELLWLYGQHGSSTYAAAAAAARSLAAKFARDVDRTIGSLSISASKRADNFRALALELDSHNAGLAGWFAGGTSLGDKDSRASDTDSVVPMFTRDGMRYGS